MPDDAFSPGFRLSVLDVIILVVGSAGSIALATVEPWFGLAVAFVVGHFFLFCNVLRMSRPLELVWAGAFSAMVIEVVFVGLLSWPILFATSIALTIVLTVIECRRPSYHGGGWQRINPNLPQWRDEQMRRPPTTPQSPRSVR
jgi:hypothetical protein